MLRRLERLGGDAVLLADQTEQQVLGADVVLVEHARFFLGVDDDPARLLGESLEHVSRLPIATARAEPVGSISIVRSIPAGTDTTGGSATDEARKVPRNLSRRRLRVPTRMRRRAATPPGACAGRAARRGSRRESVSSMTSRSMPMPMPPAGGMPYSMRAQVVLVEPIASSSPASFAAICAAKRSRWSTGSMSSENALANSRPVMMSSKRSVSSGSPGFLRAQRRGLERVLGDERRLDRACARRASRTAR